MIPTKIIQETEQRFALRTPERTVTELKLRTGSKLQVDDKDRVDKRIKRLRRSFQGRLHAFSDIAHLDRIYKIFMMYMLIVENLVNPV